MRPTVEEYRLILAVARNIVNQILDEANTSVLKRQEINDKCDLFVASLLEELVTTICHGQHH